MKAPLVSELPQMAAGNRRYELQPGAAGARRVGPTACHAPTPTSQCSRCPSPQGFSHTLSPWLLPAPQNSPRVPAALESHHRLWEDHPGEKGEDSLPLQKGKQVLNLFQFLQAISES